MIEDCHLFHVFLRFLLVVRKVNEIFMVKFSNLEGVDFHVDLPILRNGQCLEIADSLP